jgi:hypothetical protein
LPPVQKSCEFYPLDSRVDAKPQEKSVEVRLHGSTRHVELARYVGVVAALQQQFSDLLLPRTQSDKVLVHPNSPLVSSPTSAGQNKTSRPNGPCTAADEGYMARDSPEIHSIHTAKTLAFLL